ncbi:DUF881 domain-containing protein [Cellulomonas sp. 179-A 4D5 NHS]|uniref:DUF881 domain-containing protein n=1 Tax=Cellulomonas sp. 179-A 4D5 NHS TaxID=3142378 RepID=UPI0039A2E6C0
MPDHPHRAARAARGTLSVALVLALAGALFAANARLARTTGERHPQDLAGLAEVEERRLGVLLDEVSTLRTDVERLTAAQAELDGIVIEPLAPAAELEAGLVPVTGPGLVVELEDAPADVARPTSVRPDDLVVHQQDLQAVINALWAGGAEAMGLMDQRVISTSAFQCIGNVLSLHGQPYSPPYVVRAVGDPAALRRALYASPEIQNYLRYVDAVGLGWSVTVAPEPLTLPAYEGATELEHARVPEGTEVLPGLPDGGTADARGDYAPDDDERAREARDDDEQAREARAEDSA